VGRTELKEEVTELKKERVVTCILFKNAISDSKFIALSYKKDSNGLGGICKESVLI
jgi:hypothetical protein